MMDLKMQQNNYQSKSYEYAYSDDSSNDDKQNESDTENSFELYEQLQPINKLLPRTYFQEDSYYTIQNIKYTLVMVFLPVTIIDPSYKCNYKEPITEIPLEQKDAKELKETFEEYQTIHKKYPLINSPSLVYQRFKINKQSSQFKQQEYSNYSGQIYVIKPNKKKKRKLKQHKLAVQDDKQSLPYQKQEVNQDNPQEALKGEAEHTLAFDSKFESGNLYASFKVTSLISDLNLNQVSENEYDLILQNDINSKGNTQWFFFSVANAKCGEEYIFNITNCYKKDSLFNYGMQPVVFSIGHHKKTGQR